MRRPTLFAALLSLLSLLAPASALAQGVPPEGAWFRYTFDQQMSETEGAYVGYAERTASHARYEITEVGDFDVTLRARYAWRYSSDERNDSGHEDRQATFALLTRRYTSDRTDVSDEDEKDARTLATWVWIPTDVSVGQRLPIFEHEFVVEDVRASVQAAGEAREAIALTARYRGTRDDLYGEFTTEIVDRFWFDRATGMFLREVHDERARGTLEGADAAFRLLTTVEVVDASYARAAHPPSEPSYRSPPWVQHRGGSRSSEGSRLGGGGCVVLLGCPIAALGAIFLLIVIGRRKRGGAPRVTAGGEQFVVREASKDESLTGVALSEHFDPFLPHLVATTRAAGQKVAIARGDAGAILGIALADGLSGCGTIFAPDSDVCEALRRTIDQTEFFSDRRHGPLASVTKSGVTAPPHAYNVYETYEVLALKERPADLGFDAELTSQFAPRDRAEVLALLQAVYGFSAERWLDAALSEGDLAWVARDARGLAGFAMASVVGTRARLHSLSVHPDRRGEGLGTALYRARLRALFDLDTTHVLTECATWNVAALELARSHGFVTVGAMYVESAQSQREERKFVRR